MLTAKNVTKDVFIKTFNWYQSKVGWFQSLWLSWISLQRFTKHINSYSKCCFILAFKYWRGNHPAQQSLITHEISSSRRGDVIIKRAQKIAGRYVLKHLTVTLFSATIANIKHACLSNCQTAYQETTHWHLPVHFNTLRQRQNGRHLANDILWMKTFEFHRISFLSWASI